MALEETESIKTNGLSGICRNGGETGTSSRDVVATRTLLDMDGIDTDEDSADEWMRPAVRWSREHRRKSERCMAILTIATLFLLIIVAISVGIVCSGVHSTICMSPECIKTSCAILDAMNTTVDPCQDFYQYACGTWLDEVDLPDGMSRWGSFGEVDLANKHVLRKLLESDDDMYKGTASTAVRKAINLYAACNNKAHIEEEGIKPMLKFIEDMGGWSVLASDISLGEWDAKGWDLTQAIIDSHQRLANPFLSTWLSMDDKDSSAYIIQFQQSGLGLGAPEVYADNETDLEDAYVKLGAQIATYFSVHGYGEKSAKSEEDIFDEAKERMKAILELELKMSKIFVPKDQLQDPVATYHKMELKKFAESIPEINILKYMNKMFGQEVPETEKVLVYTPTYFTKLNELVKKTPARDIADYVKWMAIKPLLKELNQPIMEIILQFRKVLDGTDTEPPRWQKCVAKAQSSLEHATGALFVQEKVTKEIKEETKAMIENVRKAFLDNLEDLDWMDDKTRQKAKEKAEAVIEMIGYPEWAEDPAKLDEYYEKISISRSDNFANVINVGKFYFNKNIKRWKQPVDREEWEMSAADVNAYYNPSFNQIVFPSGILQYPFYDYYAPAALNYGAVGLVMGHELTHGFDNQGRKYNKDGNMIDWWQNETSEAYEEKTRCMIDQYSSYKIGDLNINGKLTLGENIADNSGAHIAMEAFKIWQKKHADDRRLPGINLTAEQLFYVGFGRVWCNYQTPESAKMGVYSDVHTNAKYRVIGVVANSKEFSKAFHCRKGSPMNPKKKCEVW